jgi:hexokinase
MNIQDLKIIKNSFVHELEKGSQGEKTSLPFINHSLASNSIIKQNQPFQTLVVGGSIYQKAIMKKVNGSIRILKHEQGDQPPFLSKDDLMTFIEKHIDPEVSVVALNFAYPMKPINRDGLLDGTLQGGSKENTFTGLVGENVGEEIEKHIKNKQGRDIRVSTANDTICLLLSGLIHHEWDNLSAGIVGTGLNFAIFLNENTAVNLESANFNKFELTDAAKEIDKLSASPGDGVYEKEVSGAYLYRHFNFEAKKWGLNINEIQSTKELDSLISNPNPEISGLAKEILNHSAQLVAAQIAAILEFSKRDLVFIMQGSLYWRGSNYKEIVERLVNELVPEYKASYENVLHSDLFGAAKLVS